MLWAAMGLMVVFNHEIKLQKDARARLEQDRCFISTKAGVEYESYAYHSKPSEMGKDAVRSSVLQRKGISMLHNEYHTIV